MAALVVLCLPLLTTLAALTAGSAATQGLILLITFVLATLVGAQFPVANLLLASSNRAAARLYTADFVGASLGALLTGLWLVPLLGLAGVCWITAGMNLAAAFFIFRKRVT